MTWLANNWDSVMSILNMIGLVVFGCQNLKTNRKMEDRL